MSANQRFHCPKLNILEVYSKRWPKCASISNRNRCCPKSGRWFFLTVRGPFHRKDFEWKKIWGYWVDFWKHGSFVCRLNEWAEAAASNYSATGDFLQYSYSVFVTKNHEKIRSRFLVQEFSSQIFLTILIMVAEQLYWRKIICGCFGFTWLLLLISIMKRCTERCPLQLHTSLK